MIKQIIKHHFTTFVSALVVGICINLPTMAADYDDSPQVKHIIDDLTLNNGFAQEQLVSLFQKVKKQQGILDLMARPAEKAKLWNEYRPIFMTQQRIDQGIDFWKKNEEALTRAEKEYGVPAQIIVAIIGVETFYGRNMGSWPVLDALSTLAFDFPARSEFFTKELKQFLLMTREEQLDPLVLKGSYAGAMGMAQFMPSSFRAYAVDFDKDGKIDIWTNPTDAIGSVANYFKEHGWKEGELVVLQASTTGDKVQKGLSTGLNLDTTSGELASFGWTLPVVLSANTPAMAFRLDGAAGDEFWVGFNNFQTITRYNRSVMYALAVFQLSDQLLAAKSGK